MGQHELNKGRLLNNKGTLNECGYAKSLVKEYRRVDIRAGSLRIKEWDYYLIYNDNYGVALTIADNSYMGLCGVSFLDFTKGFEHTENPMTLFPCGKLHLPETSVIGNVSMHTKAIDISFDNDGMHRILKASMPSFSNGSPVSMEFELFDEPQDSMVIATPFDERPTAFYYNQKIIGMRARGTVTYEGRTIEFHPEDTFGLLDWGRGVWTYSNTWYWSAANGMLGDKVFGFNLGYGFGNTAAASENMLFYDGHAHKLSRIIFHIPKAPDGTEDYMKPWSFSSDDKRFEATFTPLLDRSSCTDFKLLCSDQHQVFGQFDGTAVLDDGTELKMNHFLGFAEKVHNKW